MKTIHENQSVAIEKNNNIVGCINAQEEGNKKELRKGAESGDEIALSRKLTEILSWSSSEPESGLGSSHQTLQEDEKQTDEEENKRKLQVTTVNEKELILTADDLPRSKLLALHKSASSLTPANENGAKFAGSHPLTSRVSNGSLMSPRPRAESASKTSRTLRRPDFSSHMISPLGKHHYQHKRQMTSADLYNKKIPSSGAILSRQATTDCLFPSQSSIHFQNSTELFPLSRVDSKQSLYQKQHYDKLGRKHMMSSSFPNSDNLHSRMPPFSSQFNSPLSSSWLGNRNDYGGSQHSIPSYFHRNSIDSEGNNLSMYNQGGSHYNEEQKEDSQGLTWRRLHMSRAKLKATATTSELLSGFAMIAMVELQINEPTNVPEWLFIMFSICTTILVAVHIFALMISTYLLPNIDAISKLQSTKLVKESPHERMRGFVELAWTFSTVFGLFLFLVEVAILCWVKFWDHSFNAAIAATIIVIPVLVIFVIFVFYFYHNLVAFKFKASVSDMKELEEIKKKLDDASPA